QRKQEQNRDSKRGQGIAVGRREVLAIIRGGSLLVHGLALVAMGRMKRRRQSVCTRQQNRDHGAPASARWLSRANPGSPCDSQSGMIRRAVNIFCTRS